MKDKIREIRKRGIGGTCVVCKTDNVGRYDVHVNINGMRGDDNVHKLCGQCRVGRTYSEILLSLGYKP